MNKSKGFTIVEVLIVIVVIGILAAIVITTIGGLKGGNVPRYRIDTPDGSSYWTDNYTEKDGCVTFNYWNGMKKTCGSYTVGQY